MVVTAFASVAGSFLGLQVFQLWGSVWETKRVGNGHISSFRAGTTHIWAHQHLGELFVGGMLLFWLVALMSARFSRPSRV